MGMIMPTQQDELKLYVQTASPDSRLKKKKKKYAVVVDCPFARGRIQLNLA